MRRKSKNSKTVTVKVRMAVDAWLDTRCGVPEITVSPDDCSCEDSSKVYRPLQCQIQGAVPYGKVVPFRCMVRCNSVPIPEAVCGAEPKRDNNGLHGWQGCCPSGRPWYAPVHRCKTTQQRTRSNRRPRTCGDGPWLLHQWSCPIFLKSHPFPYSHKEIIKKKKILTRSSIQNQTSKHYIF